MSNANWFAQRQWKEWAADQYATQKRHIAIITEPASDPGDTTPLNLPPAPLLLPELGDDDWPAIDYTGAYDNSDEPDADSADGDLLPFEN